MLIRTMEEFSPPPSLRATPQQFQAAVDLIRDHQHVDLESPAVKSAELTLEILIPAMLSFSRDGHFIKYDPYDPTIIVKQFPDSPVCYQYNPFRDPANRQANGQRPAPTAGKKTDFLDWETFPQNEHFLIWTARSGRRYGILVQPAPIVPYHLIVSSLDKNPANGEHYVQQMTIPHMEDMHTLQAELQSMNYAIGFNGRYAGASVDHFHTQAVPKHYLPFILADQSHRIVYGTSRLDQRGVSLKLLPGQNHGAYPAQGVLLECDRPACLLQQKESVLVVLEQLQLTFNSISWKTSDGRYAEVFFPRGQEAVMSSAIKAGYVEMAGMLIIPQRTVFDSLKSAEPGERALVEAGLSRDLFEAFKEQVFKNF